MMDQGAAVLCDEANKVIHQYQRLHLLPNVYDHAVRLLLVFYALDEQAFVALTRCSGGLVLTRLPVGQADISTGHAESPRGGHLLVW